MLNRLQGRWACLLLLGRIWLATEVPAQDDFKKIRRELLDVARKEPKCLVLENGLPRRVIITRNGAGLFTKPGDGSPLRKLSVFERLYLFEEDREGHHRVGPDPFDLAGAGWVASDFCLMWDHNQMVFLDERSLPSETKRIHMWATLENAKDGDPENAIYSEQIHRDEKIGDIMFPVVDHDELRQFYKVAFVFGGSEGSLDDRGEPLVEREKRQVVENLKTVNIALLIDATASMGPWIEEAKRTATEIVDALEGETVLKDLKTERQIDLTVNFGVWGYRDEGDEFVVKRFVPLTNQREKIHEGIGSLGPSGGGDFPEAVIPALSHTLKEAEFEKGALNRIILIGDAPPHVKGKGLTDAGTGAQGQYVQIHALVCGGNELVKKQFTSLAVASGGSVRGLDDASLLSGEIVEEIRRRCGFLPVELAIERKVVEEGKTLRQASRELGLGEYTARQIHKLLVARGADVGRSGIEFDAAWVPVEPGTEERLRVLSYMAEWELANHIAGMLGTYEEIEAGKDEVENVEATVLSMLAASVGEKSAAGLEAKGTTAAERAEPAAVITRGVKRGKKGVTVDRARNEAKLRGLLDVWRKKGAYLQFWEGDFVWVPVDLLP